MKFVFSSAFICEDSETAKKVAFDPRVRMVCVTLDGDIYNPNGTLSGGAQETNDSQNSILKRVREINRLEEELNYTEHKLSESKKELDGIQKRG